MTLANDRCDVVSALIGRWHAGTMRDADRSGFEQHLLCCPPCLQQNDKAALGLAALRGAATESPPGQLFEDLHVLLPKSKG